MSNAYRTQFSATQVINYLDLIQPVLWKKASNKTRERVNFAMVLRLVRKYELGVKSDLKELEQAIAEGDMSHADAIETAQYCSIDEGYQNYTNRIFAQSWA